MGQSNYHERSEDIDRPDPPDDPFSFESMCRVAGQSNRLQALLAKNRLLARSIRLAEEVDDDGQTLAERIADGHQTPEDASWRAGQAEERHDLGEER